MTTIRLARVLPVLAAAAAVAGLAACSSSTSPSTPSTSSPSSPAGAASTASTPGAASTIVIKDFKFQVPAGIKAGQQVTIKNQDDVAHTVTAGKTFDVKVAGSGSATLTAPAAGTYKLTCDYHPTMAGTLTVAT